mmetsp:Transcript_20219/g.57999  ORF Transcript_20219/g.57999 Transcript_20219/m.57999 type:complete len:321 (-) Transcript_20219:199-1161(-)
MAPTRNGFFVPIGGRDLVHEAGSIDKLLVLFDGDEVGVGPLLVQESEIPLVLLVEGDLPIVALAPRGHDELTAGLEDAHHLVDVGLLVGHVLAGLAGPNDVEGVVGKFHLEGIHDGEAGVGNALLFRQLGRPLDLVGTEGDAGNVGLRAELLGQIPRRSADATSNVQDLGLRVALLGANSAEVHHLIDKVELGLDEVLLLVPSLHLLLGVVAQVDVLSPVVFQNSILRPRVVLPGHGTLLVLAGGPVENELDARSPHDGGGRADGQCLRWDSNLLGGRVDHRYDTHRQLRAAVIANIDGLGVAILIIINIIDAHRSRNEG